MKKIPRLLFVLLFFCLIVFSCSQKREVVVFEPKDIYTFLNADQHPLAPYSMDAIFDKDKLLVGMNFKEEGNYVIYQKTNNNEWDTAMHINLKDPLFSEITSDVCYFYMFNPNKIFLTSHSYYPNFLFYINLKECVRNGCEIHWKDGDLYLQILSGYYTPIFIQNRLYISLGSWSSLSDLQSKFSKPSLIEITFAGDTAIATSVFGKYPEKYKQEYYYQREGSFLTTDGKYLYQSFSHSNSIYIYEDQNLIKSVECSSEHVSHFVPFDTSGYNLHSRKYLLNYIFSNYVYNGFFYDSFHQLFYRILVFPQKAASERDFAILVYDKNLKFISEQIFDGSKYLFDRIFIAKEGVYIGYKSSDLKEPHLYMQLFNVHFVKPSDRATKAANEIKSKIFKQTNDEM